MKQTLSGCVVVRRYKECACDVYSTFLGHACLSFLSWCNSSPYQLPCCYPAYHTLPQHSGGPGTVVRLMILWCDLASSGCLEVPKPDTLCMGSVGIPSKRAEAGKKLPPMAPSHYYFLLWRPLGLWQVRALSDAPFNQYLLNVSLESLDCVDHGSLQNVCKW